jgi:hypothetical protein
MLYVVGTSHHYQFGAGARFGDQVCTPDDEHAFAILLRHSAVALDVAAMAEELNRQALEEVGQTLSVAERVASDLGLPHLFCEPDRKERAVLGIKDENQIRISAFPKTLQENVVQTLLAEHWTRREREWLKRLSSLGAVNTLLVCGSDHVPTFVPLAAQNGYECQVIHANWEA